MRAALSYGRRWLGATGVNPAVGALLVKDGVIVGRGATQRGGRPHAETEAIKEAGAAARGACLYVTLEPCSHYGVTPPCASAIVKAGVRRVVSAMEDPDPRVSGRGHALLTQAGIETLVGVGAADARRAHLGHIQRALRNRPMVSVKLAETSNGFAAPPQGGQRLLITGPAANNRVQVMRTLHDAILIGAGTARADDPLLTVRLPGLEDRRPLRVILDARLALPLGSRLCATARDWPTLVVGGLNAPREAERSLRDAGVAVERVSAVEGALDLSAALRQLAGGGISRVLCEGGPKLASRLLLEDLADECVLFRSSSALAGTGLPTLEPEARALLGDKARWRACAGGRAAEDRWETYERIS